MIYGYIRVSSDKQTVENQRFEIKNFCAGKGMRIDDLFCEAGIFEGMAMIGQDCG